MFARTLLFLLALAVPVHAEVVRIEVTSRVDLPGMSFGVAGGYEQLVGTIYFAVDPLNRANRIITDLEYAPRNAAGAVEFSADFYLLKPKDVRRGNGTVLFEVSNRGGKAMVEFFNLGDNFLMAQGFTLLWVGWQFDVLDRAGALRVVVPIARAADGRSLKGLVRSEHPLRDRYLPLADRGHVPYRVTDVGDPANVVTVRDCAECPRRVVPRDQWKFTPDGDRVEIVSGEPLKLYELVYTSEDPPVVGLGPAAVRDAVSRLKYEGASELAIPAGAITRAIGFGISQSGRFLRTYVYYGFNEDERHRKVFDGMIAHVAGSGRGSFNHRFAQPSRDAHPYLNFFYPTDIFPFTDGAQVDPETGQRDGLMTRSKPDLLPKAFYTNASYEYWGRAASLLHTTVDGKADAPMLPNVRVYLFSGGQHGCGGTLSAASLRQRVNTLECRWGMRALLMAMQRWITDGAAPPPSAYPRIDAGTLVRPEQLEFPAIPGADRPGTPTKAYRTDYGPQFATKGIITQEPPVIGRAFPILVPQVDADGNEIAGIRMPEHAVPLGTYTGWRLADSATAPAGVLALGTGAFIPFPYTPRAREQTGDPRRSIEERYRTREQYLDCIARAARALAARGYLLTEDVAPIVERARAQWTVLMAERPSH